MHLDSLLVRSLVPYFASHQVTSASYSSSMFPITCNAVGDIVTLASLVLDIIRAFDETRGSVLEYRTLIRELNAVHTMLTAVARVAEDTVDDSLRNEILSESDSSGKDVQRALARIVKFTALEDAGAGGRTTRVRLARQWYKLEWHFSQRGHAMAATVQLRATVQRMTTLLVLSNADGASRFRTSVTTQFRALVDQSGSHSRALSGVLTSLGELKVGSQRDRAFIEELFQSAPDGVDGRTLAVAVLCIAICSLHGTDRTVPTALLLAEICMLLRSTRPQHPRGLMHDVKYAESNAVTILDAIGRRILLPMELCETYDIMHATFVNLFAKTSGRWWIDTRAYDITDVYTTQVASAENWDVVRRGAILEMAVLVQQVSNGCDLAQCPWCLGSTSQDKHDNVMKCEICRRSFEITTRGQLSSDLYTIFGSCTATYSCRLDEEGSICDIDDTRHEGPPAARHSIFASMGIEQADSREPCLPANSAPWKALLQDFQRIRIISDRFVPHTTFSNRQSALHLAAGNGHADLVAELLDEGMDVNARDRVGHTALHYAANRGHLEVMVVLLDRGADIDAVPKVNYLTPLACVVWRRQSSAATMLLARGALIRAPDILRRTTFYAAASVGDAETARSIIQMGVDINSVDSLGQTALHRAARGNQIEIVEILLRHGGSVNVHSRIGDTPLSLASMGGYKEVERLLITAKATASRSGFDT